MKRLDGNVAGEKRQVLGVETLEGRTLLTVLPIALMRAGLHNALKSSWGNTQYYSPSASRVTTLNTGNAGSTVSSGQVFDRETLAETSSGTPLKRSRPTSAISKPPKPPQGEEVVKPPSLTGTTKTVTLTIGTATGRTQESLGVNIGPMSAWGQGNSVNNLITQGGGFELGNGRVIVHAIGTSTATQLVVDADWIWNNLGHQAAIGQTLVGSTGANAGGTWTIDNMQPEVDGNGAATGHTVITIDGTFGTVPVASDSFFVELRNLGGQPLSDQTTTFGNATVSRDLTVARNGSASAKIVLGAGATTDNGGGLTYYFGADATAGRNVLRQGHTYQFTFWAKAAVTAGGSASAAISLYQGTNGGNITTSIIADGAWHQYTLTVTAANPPVYSNGIGKIQVTGANTTVNVDDVKLVDLTDQIAPGNPLSKDVVNLIKQYGFSGLRFWQEELRFARLDDLIGKPESRPMITGIASTYDAQFGLPEMLELAKETGTSPWIVVPMSWTPADIHNLMEYLGGGADTVYGAKRIADGHAGSWFADLKGIRFEAGNESWNGIFTPNAYIPFEPYWQRAEEMFKGFKTDPLYAANAGKVELIVNGWQWVPWYTEQSLQLVPDADAVDMSAYTSGPSTEMPLKTLLSGVLSQQMGENASQVPTTLYGKKVYVYEESMGELQGSVTASTESAYATSLGAGLAVLRNSMQLSRDFGVQTQNLFTMFQHGNTLPNGYALGHYGIFSDLGTAATNPRPIALGAQLLDQAKGQILGSTLTSGWVVDSTSAIAAATTTQAADALVTFDGANLVITMFNNTIADLQNTNFHFTLPTTINGKTVTADWASAVFKVLNGTSVGANNETAQNVTIAAGTYTHGTREAYAALPGHSMGSLVIPLLF